MVKNIYGYSWWAIAAVVLNWPWMNLLAFALWEIHVNTSPGAGLFFILPIMAWSVTSLLVFACWERTIWKTRTYPNLKGRGLAYTGVTIAAGGLMFAIVYFVVL